MTISYKPMPNTKPGKGAIKVYLGKSPVGEIRQVEGGHQYFPKGQKEGGEVFATVAQVKASLEAV